MALALENQGERKPYFRDTYSWTPCKIKKLKFEKKFITNYNGSKNPFDAGFLEEIL